MKVCNFFLSKILDFFFFTKMQKTTPRVHLTTTSYLSAMFQTSDSPIALLGLEFVWFSGKQEGADDTHNFHISLALPSYIHMHTNTGQK